MTTIGEGVEIREDIPLKPGKKSSVLCSCDEDCLGGSKFINFAFAILTLIITVALLLQIYYGDYQVVPHGSVATDHVDCSRIGTSILIQGGNSIDAAIASTFCLVVTAPHLTNLDAEGTMLVYNHRTRDIPEVIDFTTLNFETNSNTMPRLVLGLAYIHRQFATIKWRELVQPAANLAKNGFFVTEKLALAVHQSDVESVYGHLEANQHFTEPDLGQTLEEIANLTDEELYSLPEPIHTKAIKSQFMDFDIFAPPTPSIGPFLLMNLKEIENYNFTQNDVIKPDFIYNIVKGTASFYNSLKILNKFHIGTSSNVAVMDLKDNYVSLITGLYAPFGVVEKKDKPCSRVPLIITDREIICGRRLVFGANDLATATQLVATFLIGDENVTEGIESPRFHILENKTIGIESEHKQHFSQIILQYLETMTGKNLSDIKQPYFSSNIVEKIKDDLNSHSDSRGGGISNRF